MKSSRSSPIVVLMIAAMFLFMIAPVFASASTPSVAESDGVAVVVPVDIVMISASSIPTTIYFETTTAPGATISEIYSTVDLIQENTVPRGKTRISGLTPTLPVSGLITELIARIPANGNSSPGTITGTSEATAGYTSTIVRNVRTNSSCSL